MEDYFSILILVIALMVSCVSQVRSDALNHRYEKGDPIPLYASKIGPFHNPSEIYGYYDLPFCRPDSLKEEGGTLSKLFYGDRLASTPYTLDFMVEKSSQVLCRKDLTVEEVSRFRTAVAQDYCMQLSYDDLPVWAFVGKVDQEGKDDVKDYKYFIFTHIRFEIFYSGNHVIEIETRIRSWTVADVTEDKEVEVEFLYTVKWTEIHVPFEKRMDKYLSSSSHLEGMSINAFSIVNSCVTIFCLIGFLITLYLCVLKRDFNRYAHDLELPDNQDEKGWKSLHGDAFRHPNRKSLFAAALGSGTHLLIMVVSILVPGVFGIFREYDGGGLLISLVIAYVATSGIAAFTSVSFYRQLEGSNWVSNLLLAGCLFGAPLFLTFCFANSVAIAYGSTAAVRLGTVMVISLTGIFIVSLLLLLGAISGRNIKSEFQVPCRTTKCPKEIPPMRWYRGVIPQMALGGCLPFSVINIPLYEIFCSVWGHKIYTTYSFLCIAFVLLLTITAFVSIALTYFQLAAEDHQWWWRSFFCDGSTGLYVFGYSFYYYFAISHMSGFMQTSFFFGYMACFAYGIFLMLGTVGFRASLFFVRFIYSSIKCE